VVEGDKPAMEQGVPPKTEGSGLLHRQPLSGAPIDQGGDAEEDLMVELEGVVEPFRQDQ